MMDGKSIRKKLIGDDEQRAVSPVIGVILMVPITVILAAVIAAFVLDMGNQDEPVQAAVDVNWDGSQTVATLQDASNVDTIKHASSSCGSGTAFDVAGGDSVGATDSGTFSGCTEGDRVVLNGNADGSTKIIVDTEV